MFGEKHGNHIDIHLTSEEVYAIQEGRTVGDRPNVTFSDSKVTVGPLSDIRKDDSDKDHWTDERLNSAQTSDVVCRLDDSGDIAIFLPKIALSDVRIPGRVIKRDSIELRGAPEDYRDNLIPEEGVVVHFGGSITRIACERLPSPRE